MLEILEFGKESPLKIVRVLQKISNQHGLVGVRGRIYGSNGDERLIYAEEFLLEIKAILSLTRDGKKVFSLATFDGVQVRLLTIGEQLEAQGKRAEYLYEINLLVFKQSIKRRACSV